ncbi:MAG: hypothetical protein ACYYK0_05585 [Candidatus Eutrophobiaceae bacterium]
MLITIAEPISMGHSATASPTAFDNALIAIVKNHDIDGSFCDGIAHL